MNLFFFVVLLGTLESAFCCVKNTVTLPSWPPAQSQRLIQDPNEATPTRPEALRISAGDIISCRSSFSAPQILLASSNSTVIYTQGLLSDETNGDTVIVERHFILATKEKYTDCSILNSWYDDQMKTHCNGNKPFSNEEAVRRARLSAVDFKGKRLPYDAQTCNSEHWVSSWKYGIALSFELTKSANGKFALYCAAPGSDTC